MLYVIYHVNAVAEHRLAEAVARPVEDVGPKPRVSQHRGRGAIDLPSSQGLACGYSALHQGDGGVARRRDGLEDFRESFRRLCAGIADPGNVRENSPRAIEFAPKIEQYHFTWTNRVVFGSRRHVVRVAAVARRR